MTDDIDLDADLNAQDDDGLGWSTLSDARVPDRIFVGSMVLAGNRHGQAVVRIVAVDDDGQVHFAILPGSLAKNRHLLGRSVAWLHDRSPTSHVARTRWHAAPAGGAAGPDRTSCRVRV